jgi:hypothetical protein
MILQAFDTIATNSSFKILNICGNVPFLLYHRANCSSTRSIEMQCIAKTPPHHHVVLL